MQFAHTAVLPSPSVPEPSETSRRADIGRVDPVIYGILNPGWNGHTSNVLRFSNQISDNPVLFANPAFRAGIPEGLTN